MPLRSLSVAGLLARMKIQPCSSRLKVQLPGAPPNSAAAWAGVVGHGPAGGPLWSTLGVGTLRTVMPCGTSVATQAGSPLLLVAPGVAALGVSVTAAVGAAGNNPPKRDEVGMGVGGGPFAIFTSPGINWFSSATKGLKVRVAVGAVTVVVVVWPGAGVPICAALAVPTAVTLGPLAAGAGLRLSTIAIASSSMITPAAMPMAQYRFR